MKLKQKIWNTLVKAGFVMFLLTIMTIGAISLFSLSQKGVIYYGNRCNSTLDQKAIEYLKQDEIIAYDYELNCNTLYLDISVKDNLSKEQITSLLVKISLYYENIGFKIDTQFTIKNRSYLILANLKEGTVSLSVSEL